MSPEQTRHLVTAVHAAWSGQGLADLPKILTPDFQCHLPKGWGLPDLIGPDAMAAAIRDHRLSFPDWTETITDLIVEGDRAASRFTATATHLGPFEGHAPTGRRISVDEIAFFRLSQGRIAEQWFLSDDLALHAQLS